MKPFSAAELPGRFRHDVGTESRTKQSFRDETDINLIMAKFIKTGAVEHGTKYAGSYGFATSESFHASMNIVSKGESMFADLPAALRARFENDPGLFLEFVQSPGNAEEMAILGLAEPEAPQPASPAPGDPEPPAGVSPPVVESEAATAAAEASD